MLLFASVPYSGTHFWVSIINAEGVDYSHIHTFDWWEKQGMIDQWVKGCSDFLLATRNPWQGLMTAYQRSARKNYDHEDYIQCLETAMRWDKKYGPEWGQVDKIEGAPYCGSQMWTKNNCPTPTPSQVERIQEVCLHFGYDPRCNWDTFRQRPAEAPYRGTIEIDTSLAHETVKKCSNLT